MKTWLLLVAAMTVAAPVAAKDAAKPATFDESAFPPEVRKSLQSARDECAKVEGERVTFAPDTVRKLDLTGDGRDDYFVSLRNVRCHGREFVYCGTGGCEFKIIVALKEGGHRTVFSDLVRGYDILPGKGGKRIRFWLHGGYCGGGGVPSCPKTHRISAKPFAFKMPE
jgi:hypothetical protein